MVLENRPSERTKPTPQAAHVVSAGIIGARRFNIPAAPTISDLIIPEKVNRFICQNVGANPVRFNFNGDSTSDYWELAPGDSFPVAIEVADSVIIHAAAIVGTSIVECVFWS
jgi:hypothetical protein